MKRLDDAGAGGRDGGQHDHEQGLGGPAPGPRHPQERMQPRARTTQARMPSTAWDRYHRWVASWAGALRQEHPRHRGHPIVAPRGRADERPEDEDERGELNRAYPGGWGSTDSWAAR